MAQPKKSEQSLLRLLAGETETVASDTFDPEQIQHNDFSDSGDGDGSDADLDEATRRAHYSLVGESQLRKSQDFDLGPRYTGRAVERTTLEDRSDRGDNEDAYLSDDPFNPPQLQKSSPQRSDVGRDTAVAKAALSKTNGSAHDEEAEDEGFASRRAKLPLFHKSESVSGSVSAGGTFVESDNSSERPEDIVTDASGDSSENEEQTGPMKRQLSSKETSSRAAFQAIARRGHGSLLENLSKAAAADVEKGKAVQNQRRVFQTLLGVRMKLQRGLLSSNTISALDEDRALAEKSLASIDAAEKAALKLLDSIDTLRLSFESSANQVKSKKRSYVSFAEGPLSELYYRMDAIERPQKQVRRGTVDRWAEKTAPVTALAATDGLRAMSTRQPLSEVLDGQLSSLSISKLVSRTRVPRSCAPVQAKKDSKYDEDIYDDADWYALLLRDLVESKMSNGDVSTVYTSFETQPSVAKLNALRREAKIRRANVDVKASKGRKLKFSVQDKIQNFLAPEDRNTWGEKQTRDLFGSLMGRRVQGGLAEGQTEDNLLLPTSETAEQQLNALRLFENR